MLIKEFSEISDKGIWELSEHDDIIITREDSNDQRVLINYKTYQILKDTLAQFQQQDSNFKVADQFDFNPYLLDFIEILNHDQFEDITDDDNCFQNFAIAPNCIPWHFTSSNP